MALPYTFGLLTLIAPDQVNANFAYLDARITSSTTGVLFAADNLSGLTNLATARSNLGLGSAALATTGTTGHVLGFLDGVNAWSGTNTFTTQAPGDSSTKAATTAFVANALLGAVVRSYLAGLTLSAAGSTATYGIAAGVATDSTNVSTMALASAFTKTTSAWAVGTGNGSLDTGAIANTTWYHVYLIQRIDTGLVDILCSLSATAPTMPASYTLFRRIGSMKTDGSAQWVLFSQNGDEFLLGTPTEDISTGAQGTTAILYTLGSVPTGIVVNVIGQGDALTGGQFAILYSSPASTDTLPVINGIGMTAGTAVTAITAMLNIRTDTSARIRVRSSVASTNVHFTTQGWIDRRGRDN